MVTKNKPPEQTLLKSSISPGRPWAYILTGALLGALFQIFISNPLEYLLQKLFEYFFWGVNLQPGTLLRPNIFKPAKWPGITLTGLIAGAILGLIYYRLREQRIHLRTLHREFELQVAALRHHYKNLAVGIQGFSGRIKRKLVDLSSGLSENGENARLSSDIQSLERNAVILEEASQRLTNTLGEELLFLKALTSDSLPSSANDIFPLLRQSIRELLELRFQEKGLQVEVNGLPPEAEQEPLVFSFEPYLMEVVLHNILSNAMKYGNRIHIHTARIGRWIRLEVQLEFSN
jgi:signal transduction histidine kinase